MKKWYILKTGKDGDSVIKTDAKTKEEVMDLIWKAREAEPDAVFIGGLADDQDGEPEAFDEVTGMVM